MPLQTGQILNNRYRIVKLLGQGGFGAVYRGWDMNMESPCAVKENLNTSHEAVRQFKSEATILHKLRHPNLPLVSDHFSIPGQGQYLVMDFVEGENLQQKLTKAGGPLIESLVIPWIEQVCDGLTYLHNQNPPIIHRDIKPANIKVTTDGRAILVDFGIAKVLDPSLNTEMGARAVTPGYSPPEQYGKGKTDSRTDIYALGATLYTLLTGQEPVESIQRLVKDTLPPPEECNPLISNHAANGIHQAMQLDPSRRYQNIETFKSNLYGSTLVLPSFPPSKYTTTQSTKSIRIKPRVGWVALLGFVIILGLLFVAFSISLGNKLLGKLLNDPDVTVTPTEIVTSTWPVNGELPQPDMIFQDDFSDPNSGWDLVQETDRITDYHNGVYRIFVNKPSYDVWANPGLNILDMVIEVEATKVGGPDDNDFGVICRYQDINNFYIFTISSDGYYAIAKKMNGDRVLIDMEKMEYSDIIYQGNATNEIRVDCVGDNLVLTVNGQTLKVATDPDFTSGDVGLIAGTYDIPGTDIYFDNFLIKHP
jgi:serine/threonine protein kinase